MTKRTAALAVLVFAIAGALLVKELLDRRKPVMEVRMAISGEPLSAPVYVAQEQGYFRKEGLRVTMLPFSTGADSLRAVVAGKAHFATAADVPIMFAGLEGKRVLIVSTIASAPGYVRIVARRDRGIALPEGLKGRKIGVRAGTSSEYFLFAYLTFNGIDARDVRAVDLPLAGMADALDRGEIDAAVSWDPYADAQEKRLGNRAVTFTNAIVYKLNWNVVTSPRFAKAHPDAVEKLLKAFVKAAVFIRDNPSEARDMTARAIRHSDFTLDGVDFDVRLEQSLLINLETEARWAITTGRTDRDEVPDYLSMIYTNALEKVRPMSVTVIR